jgi:hypothetical protein
MKTILFILALFFTNFAFAINLPSKIAVSILNNSFDNAKKKLAMLGYKYDKTDDGFVEYIKKDKTSTYTIMIALKRGMVVDISSTESFFNYTSVLEDLKVNKFDFKKEKSNIYDLQEIKEYILDGVYIKEPIYIPPNAPMPSMLMFFLQADRILCSIVTPAILPQSGERLFTIIYGNKV